MPARTRARRTERRGEVGPKVKDKVLPHLPTPTATTRCGGRTLLDECDTCGTRRVRWYGCGRPTCNQPGCVNHVSSKRARRIYDRLGALEDAPWGVVVLTLPVDAQRAAADTRTRKRLERAACMIVVEWLARWSFRARASAVGLGGVCLFHPVGEDGEEWHPHWNVLVPLRGLGQGGVLDGRWKLPAAALDDLRARWLSAINRVCGTDATTVQVFYEFRRGRWKKYHAARYFGRHFPGWSKFLRPRYFGLLAGKVSLPGHEPCEWPRPERRCGRCGGHWRTIATWDEATKAWIATKKGADP